MEEIKIEVGEYVRTNNKGIKRIDRIDTNKTVNKYLYFTGIEDFEGKEYGIIKTTEIVKHSKQLIDLIEVGDIVEIRTGLYSSFKYFVENEDKLLLLEEKVKQFWNIEKILTKEQFEANCYKVVGEEECM